MLNAIKIFLQFLTALEVAAPLSHNIPKSIINTFGFYTSNLHFQGLHHTHSYFRGPLDTQYDCAINWYVGATLKDCAIYSLIFKNVTIYCTIRVTLCCLGVDCTIFLQPVLSIVQMRYLSVFLPRHERH